MGQLFDKSIRKGFSDIFDSAYGTSALENRLKGALASSLYDARLSSSGYNKARTKTVESELANRESLRGRLVGGDDPNALDRFDAGPGHAQDYMKGRVGAAKENRLVEELQRLKGLGTDKGMDYRSGAITGSNRGQIGAGRLSEEKMAIARENEDALTAALGKVTEMGIDPKSKEGQSVLVEIMARGKAVSGTDLLLPSKTELIKEKGTTERSKRTLLASKAGYYDSAAALKDEQTFTEEFKQDRYFALELLADEKVNQVKSQIKTNKKHIEAKIKVLMQKKKSGEIVDRETEAKIDLLIEKGYTEILSQEKMLATTTKLHKEADKLDAMIAKIRAQTKGEKVDIGLAVMEAMGLDTKSASGDSIRNSYTKMYVTILKEDPILMEEDPDNPGNKREQVWKQTDDNPDGQKKLFSNLDAEGQKTYVESRILTDRKASYQAFLSSGKQVSPQVKTIVDAMMQGGDTMVTSLVGELGQLEVGSDQRKKAFETMPEEGQDELTRQLNSPMQQLNPTGRIGSGDISDDDIAAAMSGGGAAASQSIEGQANPLREAIQSQGANTDISALQDTQQKALPAGDLAAGQEEEKALSLQKMVTGNGWSANIATLFSEAIATQKLAPEYVQQIAGLSVVQLQKMIDDNQTNKEFATDIMPIIQQMIAEKKAGG